jgi:hypothetical protein
LSEPRHDTDPQFVYRRISPKQWVSGGPEAFLEGEGEGLSLFRAEIQTPRGVMQHAINAARERRQSSDPKVRKSDEIQLACNGETVEEWLRHGWHVVRLPVDAFTGRDYHFGDHDTYALELAEIAEDLPPTDF